MKFCSREATHAYVPHFRTFAHAWTEHWISIKTRKWAQYLWTWRQSVVPNDAPRDFGPEVAFGAKFQIPVARQWGREMSAPRPFETDPFHPLGSICNIKQLLYICTNLPVISSMWDAQVCIYDNCACDLAETLKLRYSGIFKAMIFFS